MVKISSLKMENEEQKKSEEDMNNNLSDDQSYEKLPQKRRKKSHINYSEDVEQALQYELQQHYPYK